MSASTATASRRSMLLEQTRAEFLRYRIPGPVYALAGFAAYAVSNVMLSTFGIGLTVDRARRMAALMRATPLRPWVYLAGRAIVAVFFGVVALGTLGAFAVLTGRVHLSLTAWAVLTGWLLLGSLPFLAMGPAIGYPVNPNAGGRERRAASREPGHPGPLDRGPGVSRRARLPPGGEPAPGMMRRA